MKSAFPVSWLLLICAFGTTTCGLLMPDSAPKLTENQSERLQKKKWLDPRNIALQLDWRPDRFYSDLQLVAACRYIKDGDLEKLSELIDTGLEVNATGQHNMTLLHWAFICDKLDAFELLLERGANPDVPLTHGFGTDRMYARFYDRDTVLFLAARRRWKGFFLKEGIPYSKDINKLGAGNVPLMNLVVDNCPEEPLLLAMIDANADINFSDDAGQNYVVQLIISQQFKCAQLLLDAGADPRFGPDGIASFWRAIEGQRSSRISEARQRELEQIRRTVLQRLIDDPY